MLNSVVAAVTERIYQRSEKSRAQYMQMMHGELLMKRENM